MTSRLVHRTPHSIAICRQLQLPDSRCKCGMVLRWRFLHLPAHEPARPASAGNRPRKQVRIASVVHPSKMNMKVARRLSGKLDMRQNGVAFI